MRQQDRLKESGFLSSSLRQEASVVQSLSADDSLLWVRDIVHSILTTDLGWAQAVEAALEKCGVNIKLSSERKLPFLHPNKLFCFCCVLVLSLFY